MFDYTWLTAVNGEFPSPGRTRATFDEARALLVDDQAFAASSTRGVLWNGLERYLSRFFGLEERYVDLLKGSPLVRYLWLGGSFVSSAIDPNNIDMTVCIDDAAARKLKGKEGSAWLSRAFHRDSVGAEFGVAPLALRYQPVVSVFRSRVLTATERTYLQERGGWDEWWQRCRDRRAQTGEPTLGTVEARRGYLEVIL